MIPNKILLAVVSLCGCLQLAAAEPTETLAKQLAQAVGESPYRLESLLALDTLTPGPVREQILSSLLHRQLVLALDESGPGRPLPPAHLPAIHELLRVGANPWLTVGEGYAAGTSPLELCLERHAPSTALLLLGQLPLPSPGQRARVPEFWRGIFKSLSDAEAAELLEAPFAPAEEDILNEETVRRRLARSRFALETAALVSVLCTWTDPDVPLPDGRHPIESWAPMSRHPSAELIAAVRRQGIAPESGLWFSIAALSLKRGEHDLVQALAETGVYALTRESGRTPLHEYFLSLPLDTDASLLQEELERWQSYRLKFDTPDDAGRTPRAIALARNPAWSAAFAGITP